MIEELVNKLAELQADRKAEENAANSDRIICRFDLEIREMKSTLAAVVQTRDEVMSTYIERVAEIDAKIDELKAQIIDVWDGEEKTMRFVDVGVLKFRTPQNLEMRFERRNKPELLQYLLDTVPFEDVAEVYIIGYSLAALKRLSDAECKTTVKLEVI